MRFLIIGFALTMIAACGRGQSEPTATAVEISKAADGSLVVKSIGPAPVTAYASLELGGHASTALDGEPELARKKRPRLWACLIRCWWLKPR